MSEQEYLYQVSLEEDGIIRHDFVVNYVVDIETQLGYQVSKEYHNHKGADISGIPTEIKVWLEWRKSYYDDRYWKRLCDTRIIPKFNGEGGVYTNLFPTPVKWREYLREHSIFSVYLDVSENIKKHVQKIKSAVLQYLSFKNNDIDNAHSLHYDLGNTYYSEFNVENNRTYSDQAVIEHLTTDKTGSIERVIELEHFNTAFLRVSCPF